MTNITKEMTCGSFEKSWDNYRVQGDFKINKDSGIVQSVNGTVYKSDVMAGNINTFFEGDKIKINLYGVDINDSTSVINEVNTIVTDLYNKYKIAQ